MSPEDQSLLSPFERSWSLSYYDIQTNWMMIKTILRLKPFGNGRLFFLCILINSFFLLSVTRKHVFKIFYSLLESWLHVSLVLRHTSRDTSHFTREDDNFMSHTLSAKRSGCNRVVQCSMFNLLLIYYCYLLIVV